MDLPALQEILPADRTALEDWDDGDAWLAGGTWLFSVPQPRLRRLHDLTTLRWPAITADDDGIELAATCTLAELAAWPVPGRWPAARLLRDCCQALLGSFKVGQSATVGGNLCLALAAAPMAALAVSLDGVCEIWGAHGAVRALPALELISGPGTTTLAPGELLRAVRLPGAALAEEVAVRQMSLAPLGRSAALVIGRRSPAGALALTVTAAVRRPAQVRCAHLPSAAELTELLAPIAADPYDDVHGDPRWRAHLIGLLAEEVRAELEAGAR